MNPPNIWWVHLYIVSLTSKRNNMTTTTTTVRTVRTVRTVSQIAMEISKLWGAKVNFAAKPYLQVMRQMSSVNDGYGQESGKDIINRFLCNASTFRGEDAKRIKLELNLMCGNKK